jgi:DnaJ-class molecular chaperone
MSESDLRVLGLGRKATVADVKKSYRTRALALHPDRNPDGADQFKQLNESYEALAVVFRNRKADATFFDIVGVQVPAASATTAAGSNSSSFRRPQPPPSKPLFTEEELFSDLGGGGWSAGMAGHGGKPPSRNPSGSFERSSSFRQRYREAADAACAMGSSSPDDVDSGEPAKSATADGKRENVHAYKPSSAMEAEARRHAEREARRTAEKPLSRDQLDKQFQLQRDMQRDEEERAKRDVEYDTYRRRVQIEAETREEWERTQREIDAERAGKAAVQAAKEAGVRAEEERQASLQLKEVQRTRRESRKNAFERLLPSTAGLDKLTELELDVYRTVLREALARADQEHDMRQDARACCICDERPRLSQALEGSRQLFACKHEATCRSCAVQCNVSGCPVCGAELL